MPNLAELTTMQVGGPITELVVATEEETLIAAVARADAAATPVLILGGGSNIVAADSGFFGLVVQVATRGIRELSGCACGGAIVQVAAGEQLDDLVQTAIANEWIGLEALSGIPGTVGAAPIQNVGAYGQELADTVASVRTWDRKTSSQRTFAAADCGFGYRTSRFKSEPGRYVVLEVVFQFRLGSRSAPIRFGELSRRLGLADDEWAETSQVRQAVLELRRSKGMVLDPADPDTCSAGSFFTNPIVSAAAADLLPPEAPRYPQPDGRVKTSAAWLIERAGFGKGYGQPPVTLSTKHTLAITNRGGATATQILALAREIQVGVRDKFGLDLEPEPNLIGF